MLLTTDHVKGYVNCLNHLMDYMDKMVQSVEESHKEGLLTDFEKVTLEASYKGVKDYMVDVKENYKNIVAELNKDNR